MSYTKTTTKTHKVETIETTTEKLEFKYSCDTCGHVLTTESGIKQHINSRHNPDNIHRCSVGDCSKSCGNACDLKQHLSDKHNIGVVWHACTYDGCYFKTKQLGTFNRHLSDKHDVGVIWYACTEGGCSYKAKQSSNLKQHTDRVHDIGPNICDLCHEPRLSHMIHPDPTLVGMVCKKCFRELCGKNSRIELRWSDYLDEHLGTEFLLASDKSLQSQGGCSKYRPDKIYTGPDFALVLECDENQHKGTNYDCEQARMSDIAHELGCGRTVFIRWNPDAYRGPDYTENERLESCVGLVKDILAKPPSENPIEIVYMFYDKHADNIARDLPIFYWTKG